jgi:hypothetical protein
MMAQNLYLDRFISLTFHCSHQNEFDHMAKRNGLCATTSNGTTYIFTRNYRSSVKAFVAIFESKYGDVPEFLHPMLEDGLSSLVKRDGVNSNVSYLYGHIVFPLHDRPFFSILQSIVSMSRARYKKRTSQAWEDHQFRDTVRICNHEEHHKALDNTPEIKKFAKEKSLDQQDVEHAMFDVISEYLAPSLLYRLKRKVGELYHYRLRKDEIRFYSGEIPFV